MTSSLGIRDATAADAPAIADIYNHYVLHSVATFEVEPVPDDDMRARVAGIQRAGFPWLIATDGDEVLGFAYLGRFKERAAYGHSLESTVYLRDGHGGKGIGSALYERLIAAAGDLDVHALVAVIALPHPASVALHERCGFTHAGTLREIGWKHERWIDVGHWQLLLG